MRASIANGSADETTSGSDPVAIADSLNGAKKFQARVEEADLPPPPLPPHKGGQPYPRPWKNNLNINCQKPYLKPLPKPPVKEHRRPPPPPPHRPLQRHYSDESLPGGGGGHTPGPGLYRIHSSADEISSVNRSPSISSSDESYSRTTDASPSPSPPPAPTSTTVEPSAHHWLFPSDIQVAPSSADNSPAESLELPRGYSPSKRPMAEQRSSLPRSIQRKISQMWRHITSSTLLALAACTSTIESSKGSANGSGCVPSAYRGDSCGSFEYIGHRHTRSPKRSLDKKQRNVEEAPPPPPPPPPPEAVMNLPVSRSEEKLATKYHHYQKLPNLEHEIQKLLDEQNLMKNAPDKEKTSRPKQLGLDELRNVNHVVTRYVGENNNETSTTALSSVPGVGLAAIHELARKQQQHQLQQKHASAASAANSLSQRPHSLDRHAGERNVSRAASFRSQQEVPMRYERGPGAATVGAVSSSAAPTSSIGVNVNGTKAGGGGVSSSLPIGFVSSSAIESPGRRDADADAEDDDDDDDEEEEEDDDDEDEEEEEDVDGSEDDDRRQTERFEREEQRIQEQLEREPEESDDVDKELEAEVKRLLAERDVAVAAAAAAAAAAATASSTPASVNVSGCTGGGCVQSGGNIGGETSQSEWSEEDEDGAASEPLLADRESTGYTTDDPALENISMLNETGLTDAEGALSDVNSVFNDPDGHEGDMDDNTSMSSRASSRIFDSDAVMSLDSLSALYDSEYDNCCRTDDDANAPDLDRIDYFASVATDADINLANIRSMSESITRNFGQPRSETDPDSDL